MVACVCVMVACVCDGGMRVCDGGMRVRWWHACMCVIASVSSRNLCRVHPVWVRELGSCAEEAEARGQRVPLGQSIQDTTSHTYIHTYTHAYTHIYTCIHTYTHTRPHMVAMHTLGRSWVQRHHVHGGRRPHHRCLRHTQRQAAKAEPAEAPQVTTLLNAA